jgi:SPP1 family predicted phage head-tail adaptor
MRIGKADRRITIQERVSSGKAANGEDTLAWTDFATSIHAEYVADRGQEMFSAHQKQGSTAALFRIRYYPGILQEMRVVLLPQFTGEVNQLFDISSVIPARGRKTGFEIFATTGLTDG